MSKQKHNPFSSEQMMSKIINEMQKQGINTEEGMQSFMQGLIGKNIDELDFENHQPSIEEQAEELIYQAYESSPKKAMKLIQEAIALDPNNADAYNYLAALENTNEDAIEFYRKGVKAGENKLGEKFIEENTGHFWLMVETRPYMRALCGLANCLMSLNQNQEALKIYTLILELNPNDNQGVRYELFSLSLKIDAYISIENLLKKYPDECGAHWSYNLVLYYVKRNLMDEAEEALYMAKNDNKHIPKYLLGKTKLPKKLPNYTQPGYANEAKWYVAGNLELWKQTKGSLEFLNANL